MSAVIFHVAIMSAVCCVLQGHRTAPKDLGLLFTCLPTRAGRLHTGFIYQSPLMQLQVAEERRSYGLWSWRENAVDVHLCDHLCLWCIQLTDLFRNLKYVLYNLLIFLLSAFLVLHAFFVLLESICRFILL